MVPLNEIGKSVETESRLLAIRGWKRGKGMGFLARGDKNVLQLDSGD